MNEPVANLAGRDRGRTDILHEYFVPPERFAEFVAAFQAVIQRSKLEFLNVTLRYVAGDNESVKRLTDDLHPGYVLGHVQTPKMLLLPSLLNCRTAAW